MRAAVIQHNTVTDIIQVDGYGSTLIPGADVVVIRDDEMVAIGDRYTGEFPQRPADSNASSVTDVDTDTTEVTEDDDTDDTIGETTTK